MGIVELVEQAGIAVQHQDMAVADRGVIARRGGSLHGCIGGYGHGAWIALIAIGREGHGDFGLGRGGHHGVGDADGRALPEARAKIRMQARAGANKGDDGGGVGIHSSAGDILVPGVVAGEGCETLEAGPDAESRAVAGARRGLDSHGHRGLGGLAGVR